MSFYCLNVTRKNHILYPTEGSDADGPTTESSDCDENGNNGEDGNGGGGGIVPELNTDNIYNITFTSFVSATIIAIIIILILLLIICAMGMSMCKMKYQCLVNCLRCCVGKKKQKSESSIMTASNNVIEAIHLLK